MKKAIIGITIILLMIGSLVGSNNNSTSNTNTEEEKTSFYENPMQVDSQVFKTICGSQCYGYGGRDKSIIVHDLDYYDKETPLFYIYIHPQSYDEMLDDTADAIYQVDELFSGDEEYREYCAENGVPYYIRLKCLDKELSDIELTGTLTIEEIRDRLDDGLPELKEKYESQKASLGIILDECDTLQKDENGNYYFIFDSANYDESFQVISDTLNYVNQYNFISDEYLNAHSLAVDTLGYLDYGYTVYKDEYGEGNEIYSYYFKEPITTTAPWIFNNIVDYENMGTAPEGISNDYFYAFLNPMDDGTSLMMLILAGEYEGDYSRETVSRYAYDYFCEMQQYSVEHKMTFIDRIRFDSKFITSADGIFVLISSFEIPIDKIVTFEEFDEMFDDYGEEYDSRDFVLGDDCL